MSTIPSPYVRKALRIDPDDKERLILEYAPTIKYIAQRIAARLPPHIGLDDLSCAVWIGCRARCVRKRVPSSAPTRPWNGA